MDRITKRMLTDFITLLALALGILAICIIAIR